MYSVRRPFVVLALAVVLSMVAACTNAPPPPLVEKPSPTSAPSTKLTEVVVGVDNLEGGFNPHTLADLSPTSAALSSLMLPSVFRTGPDGKLHLDTTLMESAEVVRDAEKFTVRYRIKTEAGWSDGAPIAAEDFVYLWEQLRSQPGVADPAGYRLIDSVASRQGGKTVEVTFAKPYPGWRTLFSDLLPAHLLKDSPRGWATAMDQGYPASGGPFAIRQVDLDRGEIILERNERYWATPAVSDRIVLRSGDRNSQVAALRSGDSHLATFGADRSTMDALRGLGEDVQLHTIPRPATMQVLLRPNSPRLANEKVRAAAVAALDREKLIHVGTGGGPADELWSRSQVMAPSERGYRPTISEMPTGPRPERVAQLLSEAGYEYQSGSWVRDGRPLSLVIAAPFEHQQYVEIARAAAEQLQEQGIQAQVQTPTGDELFGEMLPANPLSDDSDEQYSVDMAVTPRPAGGDPASLMASSYGCAGTSPDGNHPFPFSPTGFCDDLLQPTIEAALTGAVPFRKASARVERQLWEQSIAVPLYQQAQVLAVRGDVKGVGTGAGLAGPFSTAARWKGTPTDNDGY